MLAEIKQSCVEFTIPSSMKLETGKYETNLTLVSLANVPLAVRIKTTKKDIYAVTPTYLILSPNEIVDIKVAYFKKEGSDVDIGKHKFKFEAILIKEDMKDKSSDEIKKYFEFLTNNQTKVLGTIIKKGVYHKFVESQQQVNVSSGNPQLPVK